ncbi:MAG: hypothetical protein Ct9H300mP30_0260 [Methanobacteriota archaeon]|nr:MAG: hypothetical protein Ct9H300mP30_0260 [Euryarchaeota archaeon]
MQFDPLSDAFTQIFNAEQAGHYEVTVNPASKMLGSMLSIMQSSGYVGEYQKIDDGRGGAYRVELIGAINRCGVIKPRHSVKGPSSISGSLDTCLPATSDSSSSPRIKAS